jgi:hypothetical protein
MLNENCDKILEILRPNDLVLDVGGWACPFNRANFVLDAEPFETRGFYKTVGMAGFQGPPEESFSQATWIQRDICDKKPWPFEDKQFDFAICSHVLEDIRDPIFVCQELSRVAKRGYIEVPSRLMESCRGHEAPNIVGLSHHRWLIEIAPDGSLLFLQKYHFIHSHWRFSFPQKFMRRLKGKERVLSCWWDGEIRAQEVLIHGLKQQRESLAGFIQKTSPYSSVMLAISGLVDAFFGLSNRILEKIKRSVGV